MARKRSIADELTIEVRAAQAKQTELGMKSAEAVSRLLAICRRLVGPDVWASLEPHAAGARVALETEDRYRATCFRNFSCIAEALRKSAENGVMPEETVGTKSVRSMNALEAVCAVLEEEMRPLTAPEIAEKTLRRGFLARRVNGVYDCVVRALRYDSRSPDGRIARDGTRQGTKWSLREWNKETGNGKEGEGTGCGHTADDDEGGAGGTD